MSPISIVVIGRMPQIALAVRKGLAPAYDAIHIINNLEMALRDLPLLLSNPSKVPTDSADNIGSQNYGTRPRVVAIGGGFSEENFREVKDACKDVEKGIIWLKRPVPKEENKPKPEEFKAYGTFTAKSMIEKLSTLDLNDETVEGVYYFK